MDKTRHGPAIAPLSVQLLYSFFCYARGVLVTNLFSLLLIDIFWLFNKLWHTTSICDNIFDLMNSLRSIGTIVITRESFWNSLKAIFTEQFIIKVAVFCCFDVFCLRPPQIFQGQAKIWKIWHVFPDYLSVSYDYASNKEALDIHLKECTSLINESKDKRIAKINAKLDNPKTVQNIYWSIINKFLSNKNIPIMPPLFIDCKLVSDFKQKPPIKNGSKLTFFFIKLKKD